MRLLPHEMVVREQLADGSFGEPRTIAHVRFERSHAMCSDAHRCDSVSGRVFVDAVMSAGAFEVPAGSRVSICGVDMVVENCSALAGPDGRVHHWELVVR